MILLAALLANMQPVEAELVQSLGVGLRFDLTSEVRPTGPLGRAICDANNAFALCSTCPFESEVSGAVSIADYDATVSSQIMVAGWRYIRSGGHVPMDGFEDAYVPPRPAYMTQPWSAPLSPVRLDDGSESDFEADVHEHCRNLDRLYVQRFEALDEVHITVRTLRLESPQ